MPPAEAKPEAPPTFEQALARLEETVRALEAGDTTLEEALARYEAGVGLLKHCYGQLQQAEQRILQLSGEDAEGKPQVQPFTAPAPSPARRSHRSDAS